MLLVPRSILQPVCFSALSSIHMRRLPQIALARPRRPARAMLCKANAIRLPKLKQKVQWNRRGEAAAPGAVGGLLQKSGGLLGRGKNQTPITTPPILLQAAWKFDERYAIRQSHCLPDGQLGLHLERNMDVQRKEFSLVDTENYCHRSSPPLAFPLRRKKSITFLAAPELPAWLGSCS